MKKIMILGASILQLPAIKKAKEMGLEVIAVDINPSAIGFSVKDVVREVISTIDTSAILRAAEVHRIDGIMTLASDMPMQSVAAVCHKMGLAGISTETALMATNKALMRDALKNNGVPIPRYFRVKTKEEFFNAVKAVCTDRTRCIAKPVDNSGSRGVNLIVDDYALDAAYEYSRGFSRSGEVVVEEFMEGAEVSVETFAVNGNISVIQITDKVTTGAPYFVEMAHSQPSQLSADIKAKIVEVAIAANRAIGLLNGPSHTEIKITRNGPQIVEIGARLGGDFITTYLVPLSTGVDMVESNIRFALGEDVDIMPKYNRGAAIRFFDSGIGTVHEVKGIEEAEKTPGIVQVGILCKVGEQIHKIKNSGDRIGFVIAQGVSAQEAVDRCEDAVQKVKILLKGGSSYENFGL